METQSNGYHAAPESEAELELAALESLLVEKGLAATDAIDALVRRAETECSPENGARVVARAWVDPAYRQRLLADTPAAVAELGFTNPEIDSLVVLENRPAVHNVAVCTLCSCHPSFMIGYAPLWYKGFAYKSRIVREPRAVLREFGLDLDESVEIRVWDTTGEKRYLILPERPGGTEGLTEAELAGLVTRDAMIGVARVAAPAVRV